MRENIVEPAWRIASSATQIKKFNFIPSLFATTYLALIVCYQVAWSWVYIFDKKDAFFALVLDLVHTAYFWDAAIFIGLIVLIYTLLYAMAEGGLIALVAKADEWTLDDHPYSAAISRGLRSFLPLFEAHNLMAFFKLISIITFYLFLLRIFGKEYSVPISIGMTVYLAFSFFINILFAYTRFFIVFEEKKAFDAMSASLMLAIDNIEVTFRLYFTLLLVYVRTLLTVLAFIVFPFIISGIITYITIGFFQFIFIGISVLLIVAFLLFVSHLNSVLEIFVEALWYHAYKDGRIRQLSEHPETEKEKE